MRTEGLPLGGNLGLDVAVFSPAARSREPAKRVPLTSTRAASASSSLRIRNVTPRDGFFLVQVTSRRGWGAYRLRWSVGAGLRSARRSGAEQLVGRHVAQDARRLADDDRARRHVAQHDRAGADEGVLADLDAGQQDRGARRCARRAGSRRPS